MQPLIIYLLIGTIFLISAVICNFRYKWLTKSDAEVGEMAFLCSILIFLLWPVIIFIGAVAGIQWFVGKFLIPRGNTKIEDEIDAEIGQQ